MTRMPPVQSKSMSHSGSSLYDEMRVTLTRLDRRSSFKPLVSTDCFSNCALTSPHRELVSNNCHQHVAMSRRNVVPESRKISPSCAAGSRLLTQPSNSPVLEDLVQETSLPSLIADD